jgi:hypothetical protein
MPGADEKTESSCGLFVREAGTFVGLPPSVAQRHVRAPGMGHRGIDSAAGGERPNPLLDPRAFVGRAGGPSRGDPCLATATRCLCLAGYPG